MIRADQLKKFQELAEKLADVAIVEMDPREWDGAHLTYKQMDAETRRSRYWCKKNVAGTMALLLKIQSFVNAMKSGRSKQQEENSEEDEEVLAEHISREQTRAEHEALKAIEAAQKRAESGKKRV